MWSATFDRSFETAHEDYWSLIDEAAEHSGMKREAISFVFRVCLPEDGRDQIVVLPSSHAEAGSLIADVVGFVQMYSGAHSYLNKLVRTHELIDLSNAVGVSDRPWRKPDDGRLTSAACFRVKTQDPEAFRGVEKEHVPKFALAVAENLGDMETLSAAAVFWDGSLRRDYENEKKRLREFFRSIYHRADQGASKENPEITRLKEELDKEKMRNQGIVETLQGNLHEKIPAPWKGVADLIDLLTGNEAEQAFCQLLDYQWPIPVIGALLGGTDGINATYETAKKRCDRFVEKASKETRNRYEQAREEEKSRTKKVQDKTE